MRQNDIERVRALVEQPGVTIKFVARVAGVSRNRLNGVRESDWAPRPRTLRKLVSASEKIERILPPETGRGGAAAEGEA